MATRGKRAKKRQTWQIVGGIAALLVVMVVGGGLAYFNLNKEPGVDKTTLCPASGPRGHYVLLVDTTDPMNFTQKQAYSVFLQDLVKNKVPEGFLLSLFVLGENVESNAAPVVEMCNPGSGANKSSLDSNVVRAQRAYEEKFIKPIIEQGEALQSGKAAKASPIFEMLQLVAINGFRKHAVQGEKRLFLMSDMLHNGPAFSMYRATPDFAGFAATDYGRKTQTELRDVNVELYYLINSPQFQTKRNLVFWESYFNKAGARLVEVRPLEG